MVLHLFFESFLFELVVWRQCIVLVFSSFEVVMDRLLRCFDAVFIKKAFM